MKYIALLLVRAYQKTLSYDHGLMGKIFPNTRVCIYQPSCSQYTYEAIEKYGAFKGSIMGMKRLSRCHPKSKHPRYDPVP
jgi:putative membrane protein insertion efficiency factor